MCVPDCDFEGIKEEGIGLKGNDGIFGTKSKGFLWKNIFDVAFCRLVPSHCEFSHLSLAVSSFKIRQ